MIKFNLPNILTLLRLCLVPIFLIFLLQENLESRLIAIFIFLIASLTDFLDGYLARKLNQATRFGEMIDPFADKILVLTALFAFIYLDNQVPLWMVLTISGRDILITVLRYLGEKKNIRIKTSRLGKMKTVFQMISIILILAVFAVRSYRQDIKETFQIGKQTGKTHIEIALGQFKKGIHNLSKKEKVEESKKVFAESIPYFLMLFVTILALISGLKYVYTNYTVLLPPYYIFQKSQNNKE